MKDYSHPQLHPTSHQKWNDEVQVYIPATGYLPMGSSCGAYGYGLMHPSTINAAVAQLSFASSHSDAETHWATPWDPHPQSKPEQERAPFDMMSLANNFDLLLESYTAKAIVSWALGPIMSFDRSPVRAPGSGERTKGTAEEILKDIEVMSRIPRFGRWMGTTDVDDKNDSDTR